MFLLQEIIQIVFLATKIENDKENTVNVFQHGPWKRQINLKKVAIGEQIQSKNGMKQQKNIKSILGCENSGCHVSPYTHRKEHPQLQLRPPTFLSGSIRHLVLSQFPSTVFYLRYDQPHHAF